MPLKPPSICNSPGCGQLVNSPGYCKKHRKEMNSMRYAVNPGLSFYHTSAWRKTSREIRKHEPWCRHCKADGKLVEARHVDHIIPISQGGDKFDPDNLQPLCIPCHTVKTIAEKNQEKIENN